MHDLVEKRSESRIDILQLREPTRKI